MEKIKNIAILIIEIIFAVSVVIFVSIFIAASRTEDNYQKAIALMNQGEWKSAMGLVDQIPHYKDSSELYFYIYPNSLFYKNYETRDSAIDGYKSALHYMDEEKNKISNKKYKEGLYQLGKTLNFKIEELNVKKQDEGLNIILSDSADLIKKGDFSGATKKLNLIVNANAKINSGVEPIKQELIAYMNFLNAVKINDKNAILKIAEGLNPNYSGVLSNEIKNDVQAHLDMNEWNNIYIGNSSSAPQSNAITIGMKRADIIAILGEPTKDELISNMYGKFEIMKYDNSRILYFENNNLGAYVLK